MNDDTLPYEPEDFDQASYDVRYALAQIAKARADAGSSAWKGLPDRDLDVLPAIERVAAAYYFARCVSSGGAA